MRVRYLFVLTALVCLLVAAAAAAQGTSATIIGNDSYTTLADLPGVVNDNATAQNAFDSCNIGNDLARNQTAAQMSAFVSAGVPAVPNDVWFFKYSGHGDNYGGPSTGSMLGVGSDGATPPSDQYTPQQFVADTTPAHPLCRIIVLDSCGSGQFIQSADSLYQAQAVDAVFYSATSTGDECAYCTSGPNPEGHFTKAFFAGLMGAADGCLGGTDGAVTADELDCYLATSYDGQVPQDTNLNHRYIANGLGDKVLWVQQPVSVQPLSWGRLKAQYQ